MNSRQARSEATQSALMRAAEKLIAERGIENISIREIVNTAGQKNESALQYHFKNIKGLIAAIHQARDTQIQASRTAMLDQLTRTGEQLTLRQLCTLMVQPAFDLAKSKPDFHRYIKAFGHEMALAEDSVLKLARSKGGASVVQLTGLLRDALPHLDTPAFHRRMEAAVRFCATSMYHQAGRKNAFRGLQAELFFNNLIDALEGLLSAPESEETRRIAAAMTRNT